MVRALGVFKGSKRGEHNLDDLLDGTWTHETRLRAMTSAGRGYGADEPRHAGDVQVEKVGGEAVEAGTGAKAARSGSKRETSRVGAEEVVFCCSGRGC